MAHPFTIAFTKMHGLGNDFAIFDAREQPVAMAATVAARIANRRTGIGCDQLILLEHSDIANVRMRIFNADGSEVEACGNAARAVTLLLNDTLKSTDITIETSGTILHASAAISGASVNMGTPRFAWHQIPLAYAMDTSALPLAWPYDGGELQSPICVNVGNPHAIFFVDDVDAVPLDNIGPQIEDDAVFPERINVNIAQITGGNSLKLRVWERGAGLTLACGTGACATAVAAIRAGKVVSPVAVSLPGGVLDITYDGGDIIMRGDATFVYSGSINLADFA